MWTLLFTFIKSKAGAYAIALALLAAVGWFAYDWSYNRGVSHQESIDTIKLTAQANAIAGLQKEKIDFIEASKVANEKALANQQAIKTELGNKLATATANAVKLKKQLSEVRDYVTPKADSMCVIPNGFVQLYNNAVAADSDSDVSGSIEGNADSPSSVTLSTIAETARDNIAECVWRGKQLDAWQEYYTKNKAAFLEAASK